MNLKKLNLTVLLVTILVLVPTIQIVYASPLSTFYLSGGIYPRGDYTIWKEGSYYYAKDSYGFIPSWGKTTNGSQVWQNSINNGHHIFVIQGNYWINTFLTVNEACHIEGELRQWVGNAENPDPLQVGVNLYYTGSALGTDYGVLNVSAIGDVIIENIALEAPHSTPLVNMSGVLLGSSTHGAVLRNIEISYFQLGLSAGSVDSRFEMVKIEYCGVGLGLYDTANYFENCFFCNNEYDQMINGGGNLGNTFSHCWFNNSTETSMCFWYGNETELVFRDCWFEQSAQGLISYNPNYTGSIQFKTLTFERCHFHTNKTTDYLLNFTIITMGQITIEECSFDQIHGDIVSIGLPTLNASITIEKCSHLKLQSGNHTILPYPPTKNSGNATISASSSVVVTHGLISNATSVIVTMGTTGAGDYYVDTITSTQFTVHVANAGNYTVYWYAVYDPN